LWIISEKAEKLKIVMTVEQKLQLIEEFENRE
jgi:hypothetical protein